jgi:hypothetical protein
VDYGTTALAQQTSGAIERKAPTDSRYSFANGTWFYQLPDDRWVRWENGGWVNHNTAAAMEQIPAPVARLAVPTVNR